MSFTPVTLPNGEPVNERLTLVVLGAVQFTHVLDFMVMMPLGPYLMEVFSISPSQFGRLTAAYGLAAAVTGLLGGAVLDRFNRKHALLALYAGFCVSTLACALAPTYWALLVARLAAGACGGVASSVVVAMVGDFIPPERRGRAMGVVATAFPLAQVLGVPLGLLLAEKLEWHATFFLLTAVSVPVLFIGGRALPSLRPVFSGHNPLSQMRAIVTIRTHRRGFWLTASLVLAGGAIFPFMAPAMVANVGIAKHELLYIYLASGAVMFFTTPVVGRLVDKHDKLRLIGVFTVCGIVTVLVLTNLPPVPLLVALMATTAFSVSMGSRFPPSMTMLANAVDQRYRGGFMSVNFAVQQAAGAIANIVAGLLITAQPDGRLHGFALAGLFSAFWMMLTYVFARRVRDIAPHAAAPGRPPVRMADDPEGPMG
ncbi:MAG: MFS transporter [Opitutaceae bacterium]|jgi:predicted MFS family arabinose efflux permease|nr:MFS transporter [Opitutaceae bacterium]